MTKKYYKITPSGDTAFDSIIVLAGKTWAPALDQIEKSLENQFLEDRPWKNIKATIECIELTDEEFEELENE